MKMGTSGITQPPYGLTIGGSFGFQGSGGTLTTYNPVTDLTSTNINNNSLFPIAITATASVALPSPQNVGQEIKIIVISNTNSGINQITFTNVVQSNTPYLTNIGDTMTFISLSLSNILTWVKLTNV
jgi:hypothetical protein